MQARRAIAAAIIAAIPPATASGQTAVSFDGVQIAYTSAGRGETTLVFVPGWACDQTFWAAQVGPFASSYRVITVDLAGYGRSGLNRTQWSMQAFGQDIAAVMDATRARNVVLVGHSAGGYAILEAARLRPDRVIGVVGVDAYRGIRAGYFERIFTDSMIEASCCNGLRGSYRDSVLKLVRTAFFLPTSRPSLIDSVARRMASVPPEVGVPASRAFSVYRAHDLQAALREVGARVPILAINAQRSQIDSTIMQALIPSFHVSYVPDVGHFVMMENPDLFNAELRRALDGLNAPRRPN